MQPAESSFWRQKWWVFVAGAILIIIAIVFVLLALQQKSSVIESSQQTNAQNEQAKTLLYTSLAKAAQQQKLRVGMYRETFANKADADARQNVGSIASSLSEVDTQATQYRSVFAHNLLQSNGSFSVGRCDNGITYSDIYQTPAQNTARPQTLTQAAERLTLIPAGNLFQVTQPLVHIPCPQLGLIPAAPPLAVARLSDGVFPVTLTEAQATKWRQAVEKANLFTIQDQGSVQRGGQTLRKISFTPKQSNANQQLYRIFYESGDIARIKAEMPNAEVDYEFQSINYANSGSIGGYYLIDEAKGLPVYSELYSTNEDKEASSSPAAKRNIARTKQSYAYPDALTMNLQTPLEFLE